jgi:2-aminoethylphosphonate dioxygenase
MTNPGPLTSEQCASFAEHGWVAAPGFFGPDRAADIARYTEDLLARPEAPGSHWVYYEDSRTEPGRRIVQRIENFCPFHRDFDELVRSGPLWAAAEQLLGEPPVLFKEKINLKLPGAAGFDPHQDQQAGWSTYAPLFLTALVSIDESTPANGCLEMAEGPRVTRLIGHEWEPLGGADLERIRFTPVATRPGDVLFFDSLAPHRSAPNATKQPRRILYLTYNRASDGDQRARYHEDKHRNFPPDIERVPGASYRFRV